MELAPDITKNQRRRHGNLQRRIPGNHERGATGHNNWNHHSTLPDRLLCPSLCPEILIYPLFQHTLTGFQHIPIYICVFVLCIKNFVSLWKLYVSQCMILSSTFWCVKSCSGLQVIQIMSISYEMGCLRCENNSTM